MMMMESTQLIFLFIISALAVGGLCRQGSNSPSQVDIAIIGGGPCGLATAIGLRRVLGPKSRLAVFERTKGSLLPDGKTTLSEVGGQVGLMTIAFAALDALDPSSQLSNAVREAGCRRRILRRLSQSGELEDEPAFSEDTASIVIPWFELQRTLIRNLLQSAPQQSANGNDSAAGTSQDLLYLGYELGSMNIEDDDHVDLKFVNGQECRAKLVIGADGNLSKVRAVLFGEVSPEFAGSCIWRMFLEGDYPELDEGISCVWTGDGKVLAMQKMGDRVYLSGQAGWPEDKLYLLDRRRYIGVEDGSDSGGTTKNESRLKRFLENFRLFPTGPVDFVSTHCVATSILEHPIYFRRPGRPWGQNRVTLIGDAAHMMPPNMAMGTPLAFEDAVALGHNLARHGLTPNALREYEAERQPRVNRIADAAIRQTGMYYTGKDDNANPFRMNDPDLHKYIKDFAQQPLPSHDSDV